MAVAALLVAAPLAAQYQVNRQTAGISSPSVRYVRPWEAQNALPSETRMAVRASGALPSELRMNYRQLGPMAPAGNLSYIPERKPLVNPQPSPGNLVNTQVSQPAAPGTSRSFTGGASSPTVRHSGSRRLEQTPGSRPVPGSLQSPGNPDASSLPWGGPSVTGNVRYAG
jgi:hypothetical protein